MSSDPSPLVDTDYEFALCLTHDVDRPYKTPFHACYYAYQDRQLDHLRDLRPSSNPYWQFEDIMQLEDDLGVRSAWYMLHERRPTELSLSDLVDPATVIQQFGRYDVDSPAMAAISRVLDDGGWEVGLHGSYTTADDPARLTYEKSRIEDTLGHSILGGRQHYLRLSVPETWYHYANLDLYYDTSLGSSTEYGFADGYGVQRPFGDDFVVFPLTLMEQTLPDPGTRFADARRVCRELLTEAAANDAVMTVLWHPRYFNDREFPGYRRVYRDLVEQALDMGAWVGSPGEFYTTYLEPDVEFPASKQSV
ncbi:polysaccharide deacetylase family protein [Haloarchaeobius sp. DFWS5]|uniref:polysaccharide deacetylase family protein n=1 Tax=Haloarchaeobius sp. DFWS5 TaxID=3446114 RepID=UPI003EB8385E